METPDGGFVLDCAMPMPYEEHQPGREPWRRYQLRPDELLVLGNDLEDEPGPPCTEDDYGLAGVDDARARAALNARARAFRGESGSA